MQPDHITWDGEDFADSRIEIQPPLRKRPEAKGPSLSALLMRAIHLAGSRRGRISRAERIREQTLLDPLGETIRRVR
jgi:hypothetical protein